MDLLLGFWQATEDEHVLHSIFHHHLTQALAALPLIIVQVQTVFVWLSRKKAKEQPNPSLCLDRIDGLILLWPPEVLVSGGEETLHWIVANNHLFHGG